MNALEIKNLTKHYGDFTLDNLNLTLPSGCIMGLIGENGAGKSTTIKLILDMIRRDEGTITLLGRMRAPSPSWAGTTGRTSPSPSRTSGWCWTRWAFPAASTPCRWAR